MLGGPNQGSGKFLDHSGGNKVLLYVEIFWDPSYLAYAIQIQKVQIRI